jgi:hypothetical protein
MADVTKKTYEPRSQYLSGTQPIQKWTIELGSFVPPQDLRLLILSFIIWKPKRNDLIDALEPAPQPPADHKHGERVWRIAQIMEERDDNGMTLFLIHYLNCDLKWDCWISYDSDEIEPFGALTEGKETGTRTNTLVKRKELQSMGFEQVQIDDAFNRLGWFVSVEELCEFILLNTVPVPMQIVVEKEHVEPIVCDD